MKLLLELYRRHPLLAFFCDCLAFFVWATTLILLMVILAVAFTA